MPFIKGYTVKTETTVRVYGEDGELISAVTVGDVNRASNHEARERKIHQVVKQSLTNLALRIGDHLVAVESHEAERNR